MAEDLRFFQPLDTSHPVDLLFGADAPVGDGADVTGSITLAPPTVASVVEVGEQVSGAIALSPPYTYGQVLYDNAVNRGLRNSTRSAWQEGTRRHRKVAAVHQQADVLKSYRTAPWQDATPLPADSRLPWDEMTSLGAYGAATWQEGTPLHPPDTTAAWQEMSPRKLQRTARHQEATRLHPDTVKAPWQERTRTSRPTHVSAWQEAQRLIKRVSVLSGVAASVARTTLIAPWQEARHPPPGRSVINPPEPPIDEPCYTPPPGDAVPLLFTDQWDGSTYLLFPCCQDDEQPPALVVVPIKRVYMVINNATLRRVDGNIPIPTFSMSMSLDADSWTWSFSASVPGRALADLQPAGLFEPAELEAMVNGVPYRFLAEKLVRDRAFVTDGLRVTGRGKAARLDAPYAAKQVFTSDEDRTAAQLMDLVLTDNGVSIGWEIDWQAEDWLIGAGAFSHQGTYISALKRIAEAAGGYLQPHATDNELSVLLRYPTAPWAWGTVTPDFELPSAVMTREGIEWSDKPMYNRVFVSGESQGVLGQVTRAGTAGDLVAEMIVDPLMSTAAAARQRGLPVLADVGRQAMVTLRLPVLAEIGIIKPGKFVRYVDEGVTRLGLVRSTGVEIGRPDIFQTIGVETHELV